MTGCCQCACFRRGVDARAQQEAAWETYRENVDYSDGWQPPKGVNLTTVVQRWYDVH